MPSAFTPVDLTPNRYSHSSAGDDVQLLLDENLRQTEAHQSTLLVENAVVAKQDQSNKAHALCLSSGAGC